MKSGGFWDRLPSRSGIGANVGNSGTFLRHAGVININPTLQRNDFSALIEGGTFARYFITPGAIAE